MTAIARHDSGFGGVENGKGSSSMARAADAGSGSRYRDRRARQLEYRLLVLAVLPIFLVFAAAARLLPRSGAPTGRRRSILAEAREAAHTVIPFAFMG
jgi:hypothetical protein